MSTSGTWLWRIGWQYDLFIHSRCHVKLPKIRKLVIVFIHTAKDVELAVEVWGAVGGTRQRLLWTSLANLLPVKSSTIFTAIIAFINSWSSDESSKNYERVAVNLWKWVIVTWLGYFTSLLEFAPSKLLGIELVCFIAVAVIQNAAENDCLVIEDSRLVMWNLSWNCSLLVDAFPLNCWVTVHGEVIKLTEINTPHRLDWPNLDVSSTMNVQTIKHK